MNSTTYCTAVSRRAETFSSRPNINPQFLPAGKAPWPESKSAIAMGLESYWKRHLYFNPPPVLPKY
jgi:hypothetical protein